MPSRLPWDQFTLDPRRPDAARLRASDQDREVAHGVLAEGYAEGRITKDEYDERAAAATAAKTLGELPPRSSRTWCRDARRSAPADLHAQAVEWWQSQRRKALLGMFLGPSLICWVIWGDAGRQWGDGFDRDSRGRSSSRLVALMRVRPADDEQEELIAREQAAAGEARAQGARASTGRQSAHAGGDLSCVPAVGSVLLRQLGDHQPVGLVDRLADLVVGDRAADGRGCSTRSGRCRP